MQGESLRQTCLAGTAEMIGFSLDAILTHFGGEPIRALHIDVSAPRLRPDGCFDCTVESSEPGLSQTVTDDYSEVVYFRALSHVRQTLVDRKQGVFDHQGRALWFDPPLRYPGSHRGFSWPVRGRWRPGFPRASFVGTLIDRDGRTRPYSVRIGSPVFARDTWRHRFWASVYFTDCFAKLRFAGDWPDEAYLYAYKTARREIDFLGRFVDAQGNPIKVTAPIPSINIGC